MMRLLRPGVEPAVRNARVATTVQADRFIDLLVSRIHGK